MVAVEVDGVKLLKELISAIAPAMNCDTAAALAFTLSLAAPMTSNGTLKVAFVREPSKVLLTTTSRDILVIGCFALLTFR